MRIGANFTEVDVKMYCETKESGWRAIILPTGGGGILEHKAPHYTNHSRAAR